MLFYVLAPHADDSVAIVSVKPRVFDCKGKGVVRGLIGEELRKELPLDGMN